MMKKINIALLSILLFACHACDMDKMPPGSLPSDIPFTVQDCRNYRIGLYSDFRSLTTGGCINYGDIQMDDFHSILGFGGAISIFYDGTFTPGFELVADVWSMYYVAIGDANYFLKKIDELQNSTEIITTDMERIELLRHIAEARFTRAYSNFSLAEKFCMPYTFENAGKEYSGIPVVTQYTPTDDNTQYPGRSTLEATFNTILDDLKVSLENMLLYEEKESVELASMSPWITSDVIKAFQARVALYMGQYDVALKKAEEVINTKRYPLINNAEYFSLYWTWDQGSESIWLLTMEPDFQGYPTGSLYLANAGNNMNFIPTAATLRMYEDGDIRKKSYFSEGTIKVTGTSNTTVKTFAKYPGNPYLYSNTGINRFVNMAKPFRSAEQYLIAAEATAMLGSNAKANSYLNDLKRSRIPTYIPQQLSGASLLRAIKEERHRELLGEGFRMSDLKRWGEGFERKEPQNINVIDQTGDVYKLVYAADDYHFLWPIPQNEINVNPQIKNQQNPGY